MTKADLKIDWATHEAAKYACVNWHYSECMPSGKLVKVGVWENNKFIGVVIFGQGANKNMPKAYGLKQTGICELVRVALTNHVNKVSRIISLSFKFLKKKSGGLRLVFSYADPRQGHSGIIYQAGNWLYLGASKAQRALIINGVQTHKRSASAKYGTASPERIEAQTNQKVEWGPLEWKHLYLFPLNKEMAEQIKPLAKPYPKREKQAMASFPEAQRQGSTDLHAPTLEGNGDTFSPLLANAS